MNSKKLYYKWTELYCPFVEFFKLKTNFSHSPEDKKPLALVIGCSPWKNFIPDFLPEYDTVHVPNGHKSKRAFLKKFHSFIGKRNLIFIVWSYLDSDYIKKYSEKYNIPIYRIEDGFLRSINLGSTKERPISLTLDKSSMHFNAQETSDLEDILNFYDFYKENNLLENARKNIEKFLKLQLSKYNYLPHTEQSRALQNNKKNILVIGQVENDASIKYGCSKKLNSYDSVKLAIIENPGANIFFKPHPDVIDGNRPGRKNLERIKHLAYITDNVSMHSALENIDHVYTITSGAGFEALLRGIKVTTLGCPFYSGWGLTDDRQPKSSRKRQLTIEELFAAAYMIYPRYNSVVDKGAINFNEALDEISALKNAFDSVRIRKTNDL